MPLPRTVVIDTNIFDQHAYHFASPTIEKFVNLTKTEAITLLLPDPIRREVMRHIKDKSRAAGAALKKLCKDHPLIYRWPHWPGATVARSTEPDTEAATLAEWNKFLANFKVEKLGYEDIVVDEVMDWYDNQMPPFGDGEKRKEFPDALTIAAIVRYAKNNNVRVAVVSADPDMIKACAMHRKLVHFDDLPALTEALIDEAIKTPLIKAAVVANPGAIIARIRDRFPELAFYHEHDAEAYIQDVEVDDVDLSDIRVIEIKSDYCTIAFDAQVTYSAYVEYDDPDTMIIDSSENIRIPLHTRAGSVTDTTDLAATINLDFDKDWKAIVSAVDLDLETNTIEVRKRPPIKHDYDDLPDEEELIAGVENPPDPGDPPADDRPPDDEPL